MRTESGWKRPAMLNGSRECCESPSRTLDRRRGGDSCRHGAEAEDGPPRCSAYSRLATHEPFPPNLGTVTGGARPEANAAASAQTGSLSYLGNEPAASVGDGPRPLPEEKLWTKVGR